MKKPRLALGFVCLGALFPVSCAKPLDLCAETTATCLTVQTTADTTDAVDLLRALYTVSAGSANERQFMSPPGGAPLPAGFALELPSGGPVDLRVIAERSLRPTLQGSTQLTVETGEHQLVTLGLSPELDNLPYFGPPPRHHGGMVYLPGRKAVVLFGGIGSDGVALNDTWELDVDSGAWTARATTAPGPSARTATLAYEPVQQRVILASGTLPSGAAAQDLWTYDGQSWTQALAANHGGGTRTSPAMTINDNSIAIVAGGLDPAGNVLQDIVTYDLNNAVKGTDFETHLPALALPQIKTPKLVNISPTAGMAGVSEVYVIGADEATPNSGLGVWQIKGVFATAGSTLVVSAVSANDPAAPTRRTDFSVAADPAAGLVYLFGGAAPTGEHLQDAYVFSTATKQWTKVGATATPLGRAGAQLSLLPPGALLLGGLAPAGTPPLIALDTWKLTVSAFSAPTLSGVFVRRP